MALAAPDAQAAPESQDDFVSLLTTVAKNCKVLLGLCTAPSDQVAKKIVVLTRTTSEICRQVRRLIADVAAAPFHAGCSALLDAVSAFLRVCLLTVRAEGGCVALDGTDVPMDKAMAHQKEALKVIVVDMKRVFTAWQHLSMEGVSFQPAPMAADCLTKCLHVVRQLTALHAKLESSSSAPAPTPRESVSVQGSPRGPLDNAMGNLAADIVANMIEYREAADGVLQGVADATAAMLTWRVNVSQMPALVVDLRAHTSKVVASGRNFLLGGNRIVWSEFCGGIQAVCDVLTAVLSNISSACAAVAAADSTVAMRRKALETALAALSTGVQQRSGNRFVSPLRVRSSEDDKAYAAARVSGQAAAAGARPTSPTSPTCLSRSGMKTSQPIVPNMSTSPPHCTRREMSPVRPKARPGPAGKRIPVPGKPQTMRAAGATPPSPHKNAYRMSTPVFSSTTLPRAWQTGRVAPTSSGGDDHSSHSGLLALALAHSQEPRRGSGDDARTNHPALLSPHRSHQGSPAVTRSLSEPTEPPPKISAPQPTAEAPPKTRDNVIREIISTEASYLGGLRQVNTAFIEPLRAVSEASSSAGTLSAIEAAALFSNLESLMIFSEQFLFELEQEYDCKGDSMLVGNLFARLAPLMRMYTQYVNNYQSSVSTWHLLQKRAAFAALVEDLKARHSLPHTLPTYLIMPVQRLPRYVLLLAELRKVTDASHADCAPLEQAHVKVLEITQLIEEKKKLADSRKVLFSMQNLVGNLPDTALPNPAMPNWYFLREGDVELLHGCVGARWKPARLYLFNYQIIVTTALAAKSRIGPMKKKLKFKEVLSTYDIERVEDLEDAHALRLRAPVTPGGEESATRRHFFSIDFGSAGGQRDRFTLFIAVHSDYDKSLWLAEFVPILQKNIANRIT